MESPHFPNIKGYTPICMCGEGAYGQVWVVKDCSGRKLALKIVWKKILGEDWKREFNGLVTFRQKIKEHPNLIKIYHVEDRDSFFYYTMECADNIGDESEYISATLGSVIKKSGRIPPAEIISIFTKLLDGVENLHEAGVIHRDIKPDNIIFVNTVPKLSDIGLVTSLSQSISLVGTQPYLPPEVITGTSRHKDYYQVDLYALGKSIYIAFSGNSPDEYPKVPLDILKDKECKKLNNLVKTVCHISPICRIRDIKVFRVILTNDSKYIYILNLCLETFKHLLIYPIHKLLTFSVLVGSSSLMNTIMVSLLVLILLLISFGIWRGFDKSSEEIVEPVQSQLLKNEGKDNKQDFKKIDIASQKLVPLNKEDEYYSADMLSDLIDENDLPVCQPNMKVHPHDGRLRGTPRMSKIIFDSNNLDMSKCCITRSPHILFGSNIVRFRTEGGTVYIKEKLPREYDISFKIDFRNFIGVIKVVVLANFNLPGIEMSKPIDKSPYSYTFSFVQGENHFSFFQTKYQRGGESKELNIGCNSQIFKKNASSRRVRIVMTNRKLRVFIDDELISSCPALFKGGILAITSKAQEGIVCLTDISYLDIRSISTRNIKKYKLYKLPKRSRKEKTIFASFTPKQVEQRNKEIKKSK